MQSARTLEALQSASGGYAAGRGTEAGFKAAPQQPQQHHSVPVPQVVEQTNCCFIVNELAEEFHAKGPSVQQRTKEPVIEVETVQQSTVAEVVNVSGEPSAPAGGLDTDPAQRHAAAS